MSIPPKKLAHSVFVDSADLRDNIRRRFMVIDESRIAGELVAACGIYEGLMYDMDLRRKVGAPPGFLSEMPSALRGPWGDRREAARLAIKDSDAHRRKGEFREALACMESALEALSVRRLVKVPRFRVPNYAAPKLPPPPPAAAATAEGARRRTRSATATAAAASEPPAKRTRRAAQQ